MTRFDSESLQRFHYLALAARQTGGARLLRRRVVRLPGGAAEPTGLRDYVPGDDPRYIDWRWCARRDEVLTKIFEGRDNRPLHLLVDCSRSMGQGRPSKFHAARNLAALLGCVALYDEQRIGVTGVSRRIVAELPPLYGKAQAPGLLRFLDLLRLDSGPTDLAAAADGFVTRCRLPGPAIVISDLYDPAGFHRGLDLLRSRGFDPRVIHLYDPSDDEPQVLGDVELFDVETQRARIVTVTPRARRRYRELAAGFRQSVRQYCAGHGIECVQLSAAQPPDALWRAALGLRPSPPAALPLAGAGSCANRS